MAEVEYSWPENHKARLIGKRVNRLDGLAQVDRHGEVHLRRQPAQPADRPSAWLSARPLPRPIGRYRPRPKRCPVSCWSIFIKAPQTGRGPRRNSSRRHAAGRRRRRNRSRRRRRRVQAEGQIRNAGRLRRRSRPGSGRGEEAHQTRRWWHRTGRSAGGTGRRRRRRRMGRKDNSTLVRTIDMSSKATTASTRSRTAASNRTVRRCIGKATN